MATDEEPDYEYAREVMGLVLTLFQMQDDGKPTPGFTPEKLEQMARQLVAWCLANPPQTALQRAEYAALARHCGPEM